MSGKKWRCQFSRAVSHGTIWNIDMLNNIAEHRSRNLFSFGKKNHGPLVP